MEDGRISDVEVGTGETAGELAAVGAVTEEFDPDVWAVNRLQRVNLMSAFLKSENLVCVQAFNEKTHESDLDCSTVAGAR